MSFRDLADVCMPQSMPSASKLETLRVWTAGSSGSGLGFEVVGLKDASSFFWKT